MPKDKTQGASRGSELMPPKIHGKRSARPRGRNYTPWSPLQGLLNSVKKMKKYRNDQSAASKTMKSTKGDNMPSSASKMAPNLKENNGEDTKFKLLAIKTEITERINPKMRGKRSARHRAKEPALWASQDELLRFETGETKHGDGDQDVCSMKMKTSSKGKEKTGADDDVTENTSADQVKNITTSADPNKKDAVPAPKTPVEFMGNKHAGEDTIEEEDQEALMTDATVAALKDQAAADQVTDVHKPDYGAEAALASIYGSEPSEWDLCITFAVKLLMDEAPIPEDAAEVEEFFRQNMNDANIANIAGPFVP
uniref:Uncharacterized protein n=1 Tax=Oryza brachyantha TaxID=4533 RepID=J3MKJ9_ORYBR